MTGLARRGPPVNCPCAANAPKAGAEIGVVKNLSKPGIFTEPDELEIL
jgi:hypothetical protein